MTLFVAGLPNDFDEVDFKEMFELYGDITSAKLIIDRNTGKSKGYGFIEMPDKTEATETILALDGASIKGKKMSVKEAEPQPARPARNFNRDDDNRFNRRY
jgi:cold-inducible RNA-binding protein